MLRLFEKLSSGQLPFSAQIVSRNEETASMEVLHASITQGGQTTILLDEKIDLATNLTRGDRTKSSMASISISTDGFSAGTIKTSGNASVSNVGQFPKVALANGAKKLKANSNSGLFVVARTGFQRDSKIGYFDFLFGMRGQSEGVDESGYKQRPHIALYPDGNGKFIRLRGHNCELEADMFYCVGTRQIVPQQLRIKSLESGETVAITFSADNPAEIILTKIFFTN